MMKAAERAPTRYAAPDSIELRLREGGNRQSAIRAQIGAVRLISKIGKYDIVREIGRGGMGIVYEARDSSIGRPVAIKVITTFYAEDTDLLKRFRQEAQATGKLQHKNIVTVHDYGEVEGAPYLVMEYLDGEGLDKIIAQKRNQDLIVLLGYVTQVCEALSYAHQRDLIHRDVKPANVVILQNGDIKLVDFGIARVANEALSRPGQVIGTMYYLSPERVNGAEPDHRIDIWATGILLFEALTGCLPFKSKDTVSTLYSIVKDPVPNLSKFLAQYPAELDVILNRCLAKETSERYQSADELRWELLRVIDALVEDRTKDFLASAEELCKQHQWESARESVHQALAISRQHPKALELRWRIQRAMEQEARELRARELEEQGQALAAAGDLSGALQVLDEALQWDKSRVELQAERNRISLELERQQRIVELMGAAAKARESGQLEQALGEVEKALEVDAEHAEAQRLKQEIVQRIEEEQLRARLEHLSSAARTRMAIGDYAAALAMLAEAGALAQERQRRALQEHIAAVEEAMHAMEHAQACERARQGLKQFPDNAELEQLLRVAEERHRAEEHRQQVRASVARAQKLLTTGEVEAALEELRRTAATEPDEALSSMMSLVEGEIGRKAEEKLRAESLQQAQGELRGKRYDQAIATLKSALEKIKSSDLEALLQFAEREKSSQLRAQAVREASVYAQALLKQSRYEESLSYLDEKLKDIPSDELKSLHTESLRLLEQHKADVNKSVTKIRALLNQAIFSEALRVAEKAPKSYRAVPEFSACLREAQEHHSQLGAALERLKFTEHSLARAGDFPALAAGRAGIEDVDVDVQRSPEWVVRSQNWKGIYFKKLCELINKSLDSANLLLRGASESDLAQASDILSDPQLEAGIASISDTEAGRDFARTYSGLRQRLQNCLIAYQTTSIGDTIDREKGLERLKRLERDSEQEVDVAKLLDLSQRATEIAKSHPTDEDIQRLATSVLRNVTNRTTQLSMSNSSVLTPPPIDIAGSKAKLEAEARETEALTAQTPVFIPPSVSSPMPPVFEPEVPRSSSRWRKGYILAGVAALAIAGLAAVVLSRTLANRGDVLVTFTKNPPDSVLKVDGRPTPNCTSPCNVSLSAGHHTLTLEKEGFQSLSSDVTVSRSGPATSRRIPLSLAPIAAAIPAAVPAPVAAPQSVAATLAITGAIYGAKLLLDGHDVGDLSSGQYRFDRLPTGSHTISLAEKNGLLDLPITVSPDGAVHLNGANGMEDHLVLAVSRAGGKLTVLCRCKGAEVMIDGRAVRPISANTYHFTERGKAGSELTLILPAEKRSLKVGGPNAAQLTVVLGNPPQPSPKANAQLEAKASSQPASINAPATETKRIAPNPEAPPKITIQPTANPTLPNVSTVTSPALLDPAAVEWNSIKSTHDTPALERFRAKYPSSPLAKSAADRIENLAWESIRNSQNPSDFQRFVKEHPESVHVSEANGTIASLNAKANAPQQDDRAQVMQVLDAYKVAFEAKDLNKLAAVWPGVPRNQLQTTFQHAKAIRVSISPEAPKINGDSASVVCKQSVQILSQGQETPIKTTVLFNLKKTQGKWAIDSIR
jgi:serine/threonine protein kinase